LSKYNKRESIWTSDETKEVTMDHAIIDRLALTAAAAAATDLSEELQGASRALVAELTPLLGPAFAGATAGAFTTKMTELTEDVAKVTAALTGLANKVTTANTHYHATDTDSVAPVQQVQAGSSALMTALRAGS